jgi:5-formyltetrahydrofolate cyclo-ligase
MPSSAGWSGEGRTLYSQIAEQVEALALAGPLGEATMLPAELELAEQLGVSRGTLRRAIADLERSGLLSREQGRGTFVNPAARLRSVVWGKLAEVAVPDARFDLDFSSFIPDFEGSSTCVDAICQMPEYVRARTIVVMPDNNLEGLRARALDDGKRLLVFTYAALRGVVVLDGSLIAPEDHTLAATLDGMERFGKRLSFEELQTCGPLDLVVTGAAAVSREGVHFGKGHGYFDLEWGLLSEMGLAGQETPVIVSVHDCQVVDDRVPHAAYDVTVDVIVTPSEVVRCRPLPRPTGLLWDRMPRQFAEIRPYFSDLQRLRRLPHRRGDATAEPQLSDREHVPDLV